MPDTERYRQWLALLSASDGVLLQIIGLAVVAALGWEWLRGRPEPWRARLRLAYGALGLATLLTALTGQIHSAVLIAAGAVIGAGAMSARAFVEHRRRRTAGPSETKGN